MALNDNVTLNVRTKNFYPSTPYTIIDFQYISFEDRRNMKLYHKWCMKLKRKIQAILHQNGIKRPLKNIEVAIKPPFPIYWESCQDGKQMADFMLRSWLCREESQYRTSLQKNSHRNYDFNPTMCDVVFSTNTDTTQEYTIYEHAVKQFDSAIKLLENPCKWPKNDEKFLESTPQIVCPKCKSVLTTSYLRNYHCPLCDTDLRPEKWKETHARREEQTKGAKQFLEDARKEHKLAFKRAASKYGKVARVLIPLVECDYKPSCDEDEIRIQQHLNMQANKSF